MNDVYRWLIKFGYFPENYVLPPCFTVKESPKRPKLFFPIVKKGKKTEYKPDVTECIKINFPKTDLSDRTFAIMDPCVHNDIAYHISRNWKSVVEALIPRDSFVTSYSFPIPLSAHSPAKLSDLRSGRMIYEFIEMTEKDLASVSYKYSYLVRADIKNFYPSIYTHSLAWAIHGKRSARANRRNYALLGNRLDKLFQNANDGCTNGVPIGPIVSDIAAEIVASAVDKSFSKLSKENNLSCDAVRFKDDYRILVATEEDAKKAIKLLQTALRQFNLELSDEKTKILPLPDGLYRDWVSKYHAAYPARRRRFKWKQFRELYLSVIAIDKACPGTGVIDRFLSDIVTHDGQVKVTLGPRDLERVVSMLLMLGRLRVKAYPKIIAILESVLRSPLGVSHRNDLVSFFDSLLERLSKDEDRNTYLISWVCYFLVSNGLEKLISHRPKLRNLITKSILNSRGNVFKSRKSFKLFVGPKTASKSVTMLQHLEIFVRPAKT